MLKVFIIILIILTSSSLAKAINTSKIDSLKTLISNETNDSLLFDYNYEIAITFIKVNPDSGLKYIINGLSAINEEQYYDRYYKGLNLKAGCYWFRNSIDSSILFYHQALRLAKQKNDSAKMGKIYNNLGVAFQFQINTDSAEKYLFNAYKIFESSNNAKQFAKASMDLGNLYTSESKYDKAIDKLLEGLKVFELIEDSSYLIHGYNSLGNLYLNIDDAHSALKYYQKSLKLTQKYNRSDISDELLCNIGLAYFQGLGNNDSAEYFFNKTLSKEGIENNHILYSTVLVNLATLKNNQGKYHEALNYFRLVKDQANFESDSYSKMVCYVNMGNTYLELGDIDQAVQNIEAGLLMAIKINNLEFQKNAYLYLSRTDSIKGNYYQALKNFQLYNKVSNNISNTEIENRIQIINSKHQLTQVLTENKLLAKQNKLKQDLLQKHIALNIFSVVALVLTFVFLLFTLYNYKKTQRLNKELLEKNNKINKQKEELQNLNNQLNKLISIIAHDLKAPFNALLGLLNELDANSDQYSEEDKNVIIKSLLRNTQSTYDLLKNLVEWSISKTGLLKLNIIKINLSRVLNEVIALNQIQLENKLLIVQNTISPHNEVYADQKILFTILTNLISNAIKFTNQGGIISINAKEVNDNLEVSIIDTGVGIPKEHLATIFSIDSNYQARGTENEYGTGMGLKVVAEFMHRINGEVKIKSELGKGTTFTLILPIKEPA